ncbi:MAG: hypothetical protein F4246_10195 [Rhodothermaceae bacterium]|nr:hypothetical protein [Rhodothermaceae bacterium]MYD19737.1 hypothetical protein [Rhodothermaceae bacterium]MYD57371.1 hypothetical protein [Rhodothermaceae bacterium]
MKNLLLMLATMTVLLFGGCDSVFGPDCQELYDRMEAAWDRYLENENHSNRKAWADARDRYYKHCD